jgi:hypothetical protein
VLYEWTFTIPANTTKTNPVKERLSLHTGVIVTGEIINPPGSHRYCRSQIWRMLNCVWPSNKDGYIATDGTPAHWQAHYKLTDEPYELELRAWNVSTAHPHDVVVRINILPMDVASPYLILQDLVKILKKLIGVD